MNTLLVFAGLLAISIAPAHANSLARVPSRAMFTKFVYSLPAVHQNIIARYMRNQMSLAEVHKEFSAVSVRDNLDSGLDPTAEKTIDEIAAGPMSFDGGELQAALNLTTLVGLQQQSKSSYPGLSSESELLALKFGQTEHLASAGMTLLTRAEALARALASSDHDSSGMPMALTVPEKKTSRGVSAQFMLQPARSSHAKDLDFETLTIKTITVTGYPHTRVVLHAAIKHKYGPRSPMRVDFSEDPESKPISITVGGEEVAGIDTIMALDHALQTMAAPKEDAEDFKTLAGALKLAAIDARELDWTQLTKINVSAPLLDGVVYLTGEFEGKPLRIQFQNALMDLANARAMLWDKDGRITWPLSVRHLPALYERLSNPPADADRLQNAKRDLAILQALDSQIKRSRPK